MVQGVEMKEIVDGILFAASSTHFVRRRRLPQIISR